MRSLLFGLLFSVATVLVIAPNPPSASTPGELAAALKRRFGKWHEEWCSVCMDLCPQDSPPITNPTDIEQTVQDYLV